MALRIFVAYYRVNTHPKGQSGFALEAQQKVVQNYLSGGEWELVGEFTETEIGRKDGHPALDKALALCRKRKARLIIAKLDQLSRDFAFVTRLKDAGVEFSAADNPQANKLTIHTLAAVLQHERAIIVERTKAGLQAAKARGVLLGRNGVERLAPANRAKGMERAQALAPVVAEIQARGASSLQEIAAGLNARGITTVQGKLWSATQVKRVLERIVASGALI
jgi:DNA invertase Pin-like site-specific DNA recombinase